MIGAKTITSVALLVIGGAAAWTMLSPARVAGLDAGALFWIGVWSALAGPLVVRYWRIHQRSDYCFLYTNDDQPWEDEAHFVGLGRHRISIVENDDDAFDFPAVVQYGIYMALAFTVGLLTIDSRAISLMREVPEELSSAGSQFCPDLDEEEESDESESPGCALVRRAYELGYAKSLGTCAKKKEEESGEICTLRQLDEPLFHYGWRRLDEFWTGLTSSVAPEKMRKMRETFVRKAQHIDALYAAQGHTLGTGPRASHHLWTNLPNPGGWLQKKTGDMMDPDRCIDEYRRLPHRPHLPADPSLHSSIIFEHVVAKLLFEPRYLAPAGYCREYTIHWDAPADACARLASQPEAFLSDSGAVSQVRTVLDRVALARRVRQLGPGEGEVLPETREPNPRLVQRVISFHCFVEEDRPSRKRTSLPFEMDGHAFVAEEIRVPKVLDVERSYIERYGQVASLLVRGFHYGGLMSKASAMPSEEEEESGESLLGGRGFTLSRLDYLADMDIFLGHSWILRRDDLRDVYPYHLHLKNFIAVFRRQYGVEKGRL